MSRKLVDSNIEWLGKIPNNWDIKPLKRVIVERNELNKNEEETFLLSLTIQDGVIPYSEKTGGGNKAKEDISKYKTVKKNDIVINSMNVVVGAAGISKYNGLVSPVYYIFSETSKSCARFYNYMFLNQTFENHLFGLGNGILVKINEDNGKMNTIRKKIPIEKLNNEYIPVPSKDEQIKIANYLDKKVSLIDETIANNEKEIKLLDEYILNIYDTYCLKGVKEHRFKETNHYSINRIPESWNFSKVISVLEMPMTDGPHETPNLVNEGIPFLSADAVKNGKLDFNRKRGNISKEDYEIYCKKYIPKINDIFMIKSGATTGKVAIVETEDIFNIWSPLGVFRCDEKKIIPRFLYYQLQTNFFQKQVQLNWSFGTQQNIGMRVLEQLKLLVPSIDEQKEIVNKIENKKKIIDKSIKIRQKIIDELEEYKKSLIYEVVTGKIEV